MKILKFDKEQVTCSSCKDNEDIFSFLLFLCSILIGYVIIKYII